MLLTRGLDCAIAANAWWRNLQGMKSTATHQREQRFGKTCSQLERV